MSSTWTVSKCERCRADKKKCLYQLNDPNGRCDRCAEKSLTCSIPDFAPVRHPPKSQSQPTSRNHGYPADNSSATRHQQQHELPRSQNVASRNELNLASPTFTAGTQFTPTHTYSTQYYGTYPVSGLGDGSASHQYYGSSQQLPYMRGFPNQMFPPDQMLRPTFPSNATNNVMSYHVSRSGVVSYNVDWDEYLMPDDDFESPESSDSPHPAYPRDQRGN